MPPLVLGRAALAGSYLIFRKGSRGLICLYRSAARNLPEADRKITSIDFELLAPPTSVGPFVGFTDSRKIIRDFASRIS